MKDQLQWHTETTEMDDYDTKDCFAFMYYSVRDWFWFIPKTMIYSPQQ